MDKGTSSKIVWMSFFAAIGVVAIHVNGLRALNAVIASGGAGAVDRIVHFVEWVVVIGLGNSAVPFFFLLSGFFLAQHFGERRWYGEGLRKRVRTLLLPYLLWCLIYWFVGSALAVVANVRAGRALDCNLCGPLVSFGLDLFDFPMVRAFWYFRSLMLFVLVSVFAFPLIRKLSALYAVCVAVLLGVWLKIVLSVFGIDVYAQDGNRWLFFGITFSLRGFTYFLLGAVFAIKQIKDRVLDRSWLRVASVVALMLCLTLMYSGWNPFGLIAEALIPVVIVCFWAFVSSRTPPRFMVGTSFAIYLCHLMFAENFFGLAWKNCISCNNCRGGGRND